MQQWNDVKDYIITLLEDIETTPFTQKDIMQYLHYGTSLLDIQRYVLPLLKTIKKDIITILLTETGTNWAMNASDIDYDTMILAKKTLKAKDIYDNHAYLLSILEKITAIQLVGFTDICSLKDVHDHILPITDRINKIEFETLFETIWTMKWKVSDIPTFVVPLLEQIDKETLFRLHWRETLDDIREYIWPIFHQMHRYEENNSVIFKSLVHMNSNQISLKDILSRVIPLLADIPLRTFQGLLQ